MKMTAVWERRLDERNEAIWQSYLFFREQGSARALKKVAEHFGVSLSTIKWRSQKYEWINRVVAYDRFLDENRQKSLQKVEALRVEKQVEIIGIALNTCIEEFHKFYARARSSDDSCMKPRDLIALADKAIKLTQLVDGRATDRVAVGNDFDPKKLNDAELDLALALARKAQGLGDKEIVPSTGTDEED